jgi:hypothetical protein
MKTIQILISTIFILTLVVGMPLAYAQPIPETASSVHHTSPVLVLWTNGNETIYAQNGFAVPLVSPADTYKPGNSWAAIWENDGLGILLWKENLSAAWTVDTTTNTIASYQNPGDDQMSYYLGYSMSIEQNSASLVSSSHVHYFATDAVYFLGINIASPQCYIDGYASSGPSQGCS